MDVFSVIGVGKIVERLKEAVDMKRSSQNVRYLVFDLLSVLLARFQESGRLGEDEFVESYVYLTGGEKDPRNLLKSFEICTRVLKGFKREVLEKRREELFDVVFCYFPITFEPPKNDPYGITSKDLKDGLRGCLVGSDIFAKEVFPALVEKLNSTSVGVKEEALRMIGECIREYGGDSLRDGYAGIWKDIWDGIKYEVLHGGDEGEISELALEVLIDLATTIGKYEGGGEFEKGDNRVVEDYHRHNGEERENALEELLSQVKKETKEKLEEPQSKLAIPAGNLISGISQASVLAFEMLSSFAIPILISSINGSSTIDRQVGVLTILSKFLISSGKVRKNEGQVEGVEGVDLDGSLLGPFKDEIFEIFSRCLSSSKTEIKLRLLSIDGFVLLAQLSNLLANDEIGLIIQYFNTIVLNDDDEEITERAVRSLIKLIRFGKQEQILNITFPNLLASLPDSYDRTDRTLETQRSVEFILSTLSRLAINKQTFEVLTIRLLNKVEAVSGDSDSGIVKYKLLLLLTILSSLHKQSEEDLTDYFDTFVTKFTKIINTTNDNQIIDTIAQIISFIVRKLPIEKQQEYLHSIALFVKGENSDLFPTVPPLLLPTSTPSNLISFFTITIAPIDKSISLPFDPLTVIKTSINILEKSTSIYERSGYLRLISLLANKWIKDDAELQEYSSRSTTTETPSNLESLAWLGKGLLLRNSKLGYKIADSIVDLLKDNNSQSSGRAPRLIAILIAHDSVLNKENGLIIRQLYKQKLFLSILPKIVDGFKSNTNNNTAQVNYLIALSGLLQYTPSTIITPQLQSFLPLLLQSFTINDAKVQEAAINTILVTLHDAADIFAHHTSTMIPKLLELSQDHQNNPSSVRSAALTCLGSFPKTISPQFLLPYRNLVIKGLSVSLDDPKRSVRTDAVLCRQSYYELGN